MYPASPTPKEGTKTLQGQPRSGVPGGEVCSQEAAEPGPTIICVRMTVQLNIFMDLVHLTFCMFVLVFQCMKI